MQATPTSIPDIKLLTLKKYEDARGFFSETYSQKALEGLGIQINFVQDNHSLSADKGVIRGLHFQIPPFAQDKLIRVTRGAIFDVAVDIRKNSPTFGKHVATIISAKEWNQIFIPIGFAHGFCTLEPNTEVVYKVSQYYSPEHDRGLLWNDPALEINWPITQSKAILSDKDQKHPLLAQLKSYL